MCEELNRVRWLFAWWVGVCACIAQSCDLALLMAGRVESRCIFTFCCNECIHSLWLRLRQKRSYRSGSKSCPAMKGIAKADMCSILVDTRWISRKAHVDEVRFVDIRLRWFATWCFLPEVWFGDCRTPTISHICCLISQNKTIECVTTSPHLERHNVWRPLIIKYAVFEGERCI